MVQNSGGHGLKTCPSYIDGFIPQLVGEFYISEWFQLDS